MKTQLAILYARFSPRPNAQECESCVSQLADLTQYCETHNYFVFRRLQDDALSGGDGWEDRPGLLDVLTIARRGMTVMVRALDRLFRDTQKGLFFRAQLAAKGVKIFSLTEPAACEDTAEGKFMATIFLGLAEYQRDLIRARTKAKMLAHQKNGRRMSFRVPFGTMPDPANPKRLVPCRDEQSVIETIRKFHAIGLGYRDIARQLELLHIARRGKPTWNHGLVRSILLREGQIA
ncbi:MAG: recombinase family protein [Planctomycetaceae bacterium]|nr:recombinase family protein [Planctomycetaceae bacterium]